MAEKKLRIIKIQCRNGRNGSQNQKETSKKKQRTKRKRDEKEAYQITRFCLFSFLFFAFAPFTQNVGHVIAHIANYTYRIKEWEFLFSIFCCVKPENKYRFTSIRATKNTSATHARTYTHTHKRPAKHCKKKYKWKITKKKQQRPHTTNEKKPQKKNDIGMPKAIFLHWTFKHLNSLAQTIRFLVTA